MTAKNRPLQRAVLEGSLARKLRFSFSHLLADFEGSLARKLPLHNFNLQILKEARRKASFSHLQLADFEGRTRESFPLHNFNLQILKEISHENFVFISLQLDQGDKMCRAKDLSLASQQWHKSLCFQLTKFQIFIPFLLPILLPIPIT